MAASPFQGALDFKWIEDWLSLLSCPGGDDRSRAFSCMTGMGSTCPAAWQEPQIEDAWVNRPS